MAEVTMENVIKVYGEDVVAVRDMKQTDKDERERRVNEAARMLGTFL